MVVVNKRAIKQYVGMMDGKNGGEHDEYACSTITVGEKYGEFKLLNGGVYGVWCEHVDKNVEGFSASKKCRRYMQRKLYFFLRRKEAHT